MSRDAAASWFWFMRTHKTQFCQNICPKTIYHVTKHWQLTTLSRWRYLYHAVGRCYHLCHFLAPGKLPWELYTSPILEGQSSVCPGRDMDGLFPWYACSGWGEHVYPGRNMDDLFPWFYHESYIICLFWMGRAVYVLKGTWVVSAFTLFTLWTAGKEPLWELSTPSEAWNG